MAVKIDSVRRVNGRVVKLRALIGGIEITYGRVEGSDEPQEISRSRDDIQVLDRDSLSISPGEFSKLRRKVYKIFSEVRPPKNDFSAKKKVKIIQETLF